MDSTVPAVVEKHRFSFHGSGTDLAVIWLKNIFFIIITFGFYGAWARTNTRRFMWSQTAFKDDRFAYTGTGRELFLGWIKLILILFVAAFILNIIQFMIPFFKYVSALLLPFLYMYVFALATYSGLRYRALRTLWRQIRFNVTRTKESTREFTLLYMKGTVFSALSFGLYTPYFTIKRNQFLIDRSNYGGIPFSFDGRGDEYFKICVKGFFLSIITLGGYLPWFFVDRFRYRLNHTHLGANSFHLNVSAKDLLIYSVVGYIVTLMTIGIASPWVVTKLMGLVVDGVSLEGPLDLTNVQNFEQSESAMGDDFAVSYDVDLGF